MKDAWLTCMITPGQFSCEYAVEGVAHNGEGFSLFACDYDLDFRTPPTGSERIHGWIRVEILKTSGDLALIRLPQPTMENGETITVNRQNLKASACPEAVK